jgi:hypothetical protein
VSLWSSIKKIGRAIDPTNPKAPLGSLIATGISVIPGGGAVLGGVNAVNSATKGATKPPAAPVPVAPPVPAAPSMTTKLLAFTGSTTGTVVGLAVAAVLAVYLFAKRR